MSVWTARINSTHKKTLPSVAVFGQESQTGNQIGQLTLPIQIFPAERTTSLRVHHRSHKQRSIRLLPPAKLAQAYKTDLSELHLWHGCPTATMKVSPHLSAPKQTSRSTKMSALLHQYLRCRLEIAPQPVASRKLRTGTSLLASRKGIVKTTSASCSRIQLRHPQIEWHLHSRIIRTCTISSTIICLFPSQRQAQRSEVVTPWA